jgi:two-component system, LytTR family, sensor kinase
VQLLKNNIKNISWLIVILCLFSLPGRGSEKQDSLIIDIGEQNSSSKVLMVSDFENFDISTVADSDKNWKNDISLNELKNNNVMVARVIIEGYQNIQKPAIFFSGKFSQFAIYQDTTKIFTLNDSSNPEQYFVSKELPLNPELPMVIYFVGGYRNIWDLPELEYLRIGERNAVVDGIIPFPSETAKWVLDLVLAFVILSGGIIFTLGACSFSGRNRKMLVYLALFSFSSGTSSLLYQFRFFIDLPPFSFTVLLLIISTLSPWAFIGFLKHAVQTSFRLFLKIAYWLSLGWCIFFPLLSQYIPVLSLYWGGLGFNMFLTTGILVKERIYKIKNFHPPLIGFLLLIILLIIDCLYSFSLIPFPGHSDWGILALILGLAVFITRDVASSKKQVIAYEKEISRSKIKMLALENKNIQSQYQALKNQINPHFLFNSLNTLASLIRINTDKAATFVQEFSNLYRNILDLNDKSLISIGKELKLLESYIYLQKMRKGRYLMFDFAIKDEDQEQLVPPLSLQLLIENAIKHNEISEENPMLIQINSDGRFIEVRNKLNPKYKTTHREGIGLKNLLSRYEHFSIDKPVFKKTDKEFIAKIPIIQDT